MCNLYSNLSTADEMQRLFQVDPEKNYLGNAPAMPAIWPKASAPVVRNADGQGTPELLNMNWGFLTPKYSKRDGSPIKPAAWHNARDDKIDRTQFWKSSFLNRRCLVPATSFCEMKGRAPTTYVWFGMAADLASGGRSLFAFAGIWRATPPGVGKDVRNMLTYSVITTVPNELVATVHPNRMPVILDPLDYGTWLDGSSDDARALLRPYPAERMRVVRAGNQARDDFPD